MSWFINILHKFGQWDDSDDIDNEIRNSINPQWMERLPNRQYYWQVSLDNAMRKGRKKHGPLWDGPEFESSDLSADKHDIKKRVFFDWLDRVPPIVTHHLKNMIDEHLDRTEGFRPFDTKKHNEDDIEPWTSEQLEQWMEQ